MAKGHFIGVRISDMEFKQIESAKLKNETISQTVRRLLLQAIKNEREDIEGWKDLVARIEKADMSEISKKTDRVLTILSELKNSSST